MKHFKLILTVMRVVVTLLFAANAVFMVQLYNSIKERYVSDVEQCLNRADHIEMVDRIVEAGLGDEDGVVGVSIWLHKSDVGTAMTPEELWRMNYSQRFRRVDRQIMAMISEHLHGYYGDRIGSPDLARMEEAFRRDLNFSGYNPEVVRIVSANDNEAGHAGLWKIEYRVNGHLTYLAFISPLTGNILGEMSGVIATSALIAFVLTFGFWYLLHVIARQRTIEEMKDDFTNNMTHELKTPIAIAYAANDSLLQFPDPGNEERTKKYLTAALEQLSKLAGLVESILAMSMERRRNLTMAKEKITLRPFLTAIIGQQQLKADKPCRITLVCREDSAVDADPTHFSNVIGNLIDNSIKYSGSSVDIIVEADSEGVSVSDNGIGIPEKSLPEIWNKFYRVPQGNRQAARGYGIGLFYIKSIVDRHGWRIAVESKQNKGSKFSIKFS